MRIALAQIISGGDSAENLKLVAAEVERAAAAGAELVVFPEATQCAFGHDLSAAAEPLDGPWAGAVRELALRHGIAVVVGMFTPGGDGRVTNSLLAAGPGLDEHYDKIHLFDAFGYRESDGVQPGATPVTIGVGDARFGLATCYDVRFPALFLAHADAGARVSIVCASWGAGAGKLEQWRLLAQARALDTTSYVVAVDQGDPATLGRTADAAPTGIGHSLVVSPLGAVLHEMSDEAGMLVVDLDLTAVDEARAALPVLANRVTAFG